MFLRIPRCLSFERARAVPVFRRGLWAVALCLGLLFGRASSAERYVDTKERFTLELPEGWKLAPVFGDTRGMTFRKDLASRRHASAKLAVRVDPRSTVLAADVERYLDAREAELRSSGQLKRTSARLGAGEGSAGRGLGAGGNDGPKSDVPKSDRPRADPRGVLCSRRYRFKGTKEDPPSTIAAYAFETDSAFYLVLFEARSSDFSLFDRDRRSILRSFVPAASGTLTARGDRVEPVPPRDPSSAPAQRKGPGSVVGAQLQGALIGRWRSRTGTRLTFAGDGHFVLGPMKGRFKVEGPTLILATPSGRELRFEVELSPDEIVLTSSALSSSASYVRDASPLSPVGEWETQTPQGSARLSILKEGTFVLGSMRGHWSTSEDMIRFVGEHAERISYQYQLEGDALILSGGDLDEPATFRKVP